MKAKTFDDQFEKGDDITRHLDLHSLDREAHRLGVTRQSVIKMWLAEKLKEAVA